MQVIVRGCAAGNAWLRRMACDQAVAATVGGGLEGEDSELHCRPNICIRDGRLKPIQP